MVRFLTILLTVGMAFATTVPAETAKAPIPSEQIPEQVIDWTARACMKKGCPLVQWQIEDIQALCFDGDFRKPLLSILNNAQEQAVKMEIRETAIQRLSAYLGKAGCPLTDTQQAHMKTLDPATVSISQVASILTDKQEETLQRFLPKDISEWALKGLSSRLDRAGYPLTPEQVERLKTLTPEKETPDSLREILTGEQARALWKGFGEGPGSEALLRGFSQYLETSGCPLTPEQESQLKQLPSGKGSFLSILTDKQKKALRFPEKTE